MDTVKRRALAVLIGALVLVLAFPVLANAAGRQGQSGRETPGKQSATASQPDYVLRGGTCLVDLDGDGVCDNYVPGTGRGAGYVDANGDGICDNHPSACFVDNDGDGRCDNFIPESRMKGKAARCAPRPT